MFVRKFPRGLTLVCVITFAAAAALIIYARSHRGPIDVPFSTLLQRADHGDVARLSVDGDRIDFTLVSGESFRTVALPNYLTSNPTFAADLARHNVAIDVHATGAEGVFNAAVLALMFAATLGMVAWRLGYDRLLWLGEKTTVAEPAQTTVTFADVAGVDEAKDEVRDIVDFLREPQRFAAVGGRIPRGVLMVGPPGTGKTLLARSIAGEAGVPFLFASGSDFVEMYAGVGAKRIRKLFKDARRHPACIVFIDEIDAVGRSRGGHSVSHEEREQTLNQLLVEMDGFVQSNTVVVIAATNRADVLDPALLRPGRFDRQVTVGAPDLKGREHILAIHARRVVLAGDINLRDVARGTPGFSGAELANLVNEAALLAVRRGATRVGRIDFDQARDKILMGAERKSLTMTEHERKTCAYHEAGHAVVAALLPHADPLHKVTIIPRGRALGVTMQVPVADRHTHSRVFLETQLAILMGGRVAEEVFLDQLTSGAKNDIDRATDIARSMVCEFGMSKTLGPLAYPSPDGRGGRGVSEATARVVDDEVRTLVMQGYETAFALISARQSAVRAVAEELLLVESLDARELEAVIAAA